MNERGRIQADPGRTDRQEDRPVSEVGHWGWGGGVGVLNDLFVTGHSSINFAPSPALDPHYGPGGGVSGSMFSWKEG